MKYTFKEARDILGVSKNCLKDDLEKKYDIALKKYKILKTQGLLDEKAEEDFIKTTEAYRILMGYEVDEPQVEQTNTALDKAYGKAGLDRKGVNNFFHYHKVHILIGLIAIIVISLTVRSFVTRVEPDVTIGLMGEVNQDACDAFKLKITKNIPEIKEVAFDSALLSEDMGGEQAYAYMTKAMVLLAASDIDIFIVNKYAYDRYAPNGAFMDMSSTLKDLYLDREKNEKLKIRVVDETDAQGNITAYKDKEPQLYGLDVSDSEFFKDVNVVGPEKILVVRASQKQPELTQKLVKLFVK